VLRLDLGRSFGNGQPVAQLFRERLAASASLTGLALAVSVGIGLPLGGLAAVRAGRWPDTLGRVIALVGASLPGFWLALLLMWLFAAQLHWVPALGSFTPAGIVLPTLVLAARPMGRLTRLMRATTMDALTLDCMTVAHAKGLPAHVVLRRHVLPNALLPVITVVALDAATLLANSVVVEWVFAWPGVGRLGADAALTGDAPVLMAFVLLVGAVVVALNGAADLLHGLVDPRQRPGSVV
jgi:peptide/nickel transport system permease protein